MGYFVSANQAVIAVVAASIAHLMCTRSLSFLQSKNLDVVKTATKLRRDKGVLGLSFTVALPIFSKKKNNNFAL